MDIKKLLNERIETTVMQALGVCVMVIGVMDAIKPVSGIAGVLVVLISFAIGGIIGAALNIQKGLDNLGASFEKFIKSKNIVKNEKLGDNFAEGFVQATMIFCVGAMTIYGSISAGLGDNKTLLVKTVLDGVMALLLTVKYGVGVAFAAIPIILIQGTFALLAGVVGDYLTANVNFQQELSAIGGVIVYMIGINILEIWHKLDP